MTIILHKCGHTGKSRVYGNEAAQAKRIAELQQGDCADCWLKKKPIYFSVRVSKEYGIVMSGHNCYSIREKLKERGYHFARPVWRKKLVDEVERDGELLWIAEQGFSMAEEKVITPQELRMRRKEAKRKREATARRSHRAAVKANKEYAMAKSAKENSVTDF